MVAWAVCALLVSKNASMTDWTPDSTQYIAVVVDPARGPGLASHFGEVRGYKSGKGLEQVTEKFVSEVARVGRSADNAFNDLRALIGEGLDRHNALSARGQALEVLMDQMRQRLEQIDTVLDTKLAPFVNSVSHRLNAVERALSHGEECHK